MHTSPGVGFTKGLSQVLGLTFVQKYSQLKPETWLRPFVNTALGVMSVEIFKTLNGRDSNLTFVVNYFFFTLFLWIEYILVQLTTLVQACIRLLLHLFFIGFRCISVTCIAIDVTVIKILKYSVQITSNIN